MQTYKELLKKAKAIVSEEDKNRRLYFQDSKLMKK